MRIRNLIPENQTTQRQKLALVWLQNVLLAKMSAHPALSKRDWHISVRLTPNGKHYQGLTISDGQNRLLIDPGDRFHDTHVHLRSPVAVQENILWNWIVPAINRFKMDPILLKKERIERQINKTLRLSKFCHF